MAAQDSTPTQEYASITDRISSIVLHQRTPRAWLIGFGVSLFLTLLLFVALAYLLVRGVGIWGINVPVGWGFAITNFVWWVSIGHAGTLISAILLLLRQQWRTSINRFAEAITLFAAACALLFPLIHLGRPWFFYWFLPYPNTLDLLPQFQSPLMWDFIAVFTHSVVALLFWYIGLIPDLATLRDRARSRLPQLVYGFLSMGWRGSARHWQRYQQSYFLLAVLVTPLMVSVQSIVGLDFAVSVVPGWHTTLAPPFFVAGAVFSGFAMILAIAVPLRRFFNLEDLITPQHLDNMAKVILAMSWLVIYGYVMQIFTGWYSGRDSELFLIQNRLLGPYAPVYWAMLVCNGMVAQLLWLRPVRYSPTLLFVIALIINVGMWLERFVIVIVSLHGDFLPSSWDMFIPTVWDWVTLLGSIGLFFTLLFLFIRFLPTVSIAEVRDMIAEDKEGIS